MISAILKIVEDDPRYKLEAYEFVRRALAYAQEELMMESDTPEDDTDDEDDSDADISDFEESGGTERHLTGQQLCEAIRRYAVDQFGYMAEIVLKSWGITTTSDFGEIVYNMIRVEQMRKSPNDRREHFNEVYDFDQAFNKSFRIQPPSA